MRATSAGISFEATLMRPCARRRWREVRLSSPEKILNQRGRMWTSSPNCVSLPLASLMAECCAPRQPSARLSRAQVRAVRPARCRGDRERVNSFGKREKC